MLSEIPWRMLLQSPESILQVDHLSKSYGIVQALRDLSFAVTPGSVVGLLGPNGSGKTTLLKILLGVSRPTSGDFAWWPGHPAPPRPVIGSLLEQANFYPYLSGYQNLRLICIIRQVGTSYITPTLDRVGLCAPAGKMKVAQYSFGMRQRLALAAALLGEPEVIVLDEPTNGLDPSGIAIVRDLMTALRREGKTVILASHLLGEVEKVCTHIGVLQRSALINWGPMSEVLGSEVWIDVSYPDSETLLDLLNRSDLVTQVHRRETGLMSVQTVNDDAAQLNRYLASAGVYVDHLAVRKSDLESQILALLQEGG